MNKFAIILLAAGAAGIVASDIGATLPQEWRSGTPAPAEHPGPSVPADAVSNEVVAEYCVRCHSERRQVGGLVLEGFDIAHAEQRRPTIEKMIRKLRAGMMPPNGQPRPEADVIDAMAAELEDAMDEIAVPGTRIPDGAPSSVSTGPSTGARSRTCWASTWT